jgi:phage shock protein A
MSEPSQEQKIQWALEVLGNANYGQQANECRHAVDFIGKHIVDMSGDLAAAERNMNDLVMQNTLLRSHINQITSDNVMYANHCEYLRVENQRLGASVASHLAENTRYIGNNNILFDQVAYLTSKITKLEGEKENFIDKIDTHRECFNKAAMKAEAYMNERDKLAQELLACKQESNDRIDALRKEVSDLRTFNRAVNVALEDTHRANVELKKQCSCQNMLGL